ncbi:hypothetical protein [Bradyrhizobium sp.]|uniref:hypothetical protein n=1 Tax=Bradyrhizobium sp. TaxID=376 RepID=UPI0025BDCD75|nr:hypothetical protein [Bradyrhizobium sp.]
MSGIKLRIASMQFGPSRQHATTLKPLRASRTLVKPRRTTGWLSAITTVMQRMACPQPVPPGLILSRPVSPYNPSQDGTHSLPSSLKQPACGLAELRRINRNDPTATIDGYMRQTMSVDIFSTYN